MRIKPYLLFIIIIVIAGLSTLDLENRGIRASCYERRIISELEINSAVIDKYNDVNVHNNNTLILENIYSHEQSKIYIVHEKSGFFDNISIGDTLFKKVGELKVLNITNREIVELVYNCDKAE